MKKTILLAVMMFTAISVMGADKKSTNSQVDTQKTTSEMVSLIDEKKADNYLVVFHDIDKLVIMNDSNAIIHVYNDKMELVVESTDSINMELPAGTYYVTSDRKIKSKYISE